MADFLSIVATTAGGAGALVAVVQSVRAFGTARLLAATGPSALGELTETLAEVRGTAQSEGEVSAPVSGRTGLYARLLVEQQRRTRWETVLDHKRAVPFTLDDGTGRVRVDPSEAEVVVSGPARVRAGVVANPSEEWTRLVEAAGPVETEPQAPFLRWREEVVEPGAVLTIIGRARKEEEDWELVADPEGFVVSDREEDDVVRHHRRLGWRWAGVLLLATPVLGWGVWGLFS